MFGSPASPPALHRRLANVFLSPISLSPLSLLASWFVDFVDRLVAAGQLLTALKKVSERRISRSRSGRGGGGNDRHTEERHIQKAVQNLQQVK